MCTPITSWHEIGKSVSISIFTHSDVYYPFEYSVKENMRTFNSNYCLVSRLLFIYISLMWEPFGTILQDHAIKKEKINGNM